VSDRVRESEANLEGSEKSYTLVELDYTMKKWERRRRRRRRRRKEIEWRVLRMPDEAICPATAPLLFVTTEKVFGFLSRKIYSPKRGSS